MSQWCCQAHQTQNHTRVSPSFPSIHRDASRDLLAQVTVLSVSHQTGPLPIPFSYQHLYQSLTRMKLRNKLPSSGIFGFSPAFQIPQSSLHSFQLKSLPLPAFWIPLFLTSMISNAISGDTPLGIYKEKLLGLLSQEVQSVGGEPDQREG